VISAFVSWLLTLFRRHFDVFVESSGFAGRPTSSPETGHPNDSNVTAGRQRQNVTNSNRLTRLFHGPGIESHPSFGAIGVGDGLAFVEKCIPRTLIDPSAWPLLIHVDVAPSDLVSNASSTEKGDDVCFFFPEVRVGARL
jgi:hypothetical protein